MGDGASLKSARMHRRKKNKNNALEVLDEVIYHEVPVTHEVIKYIPKKVYVDVEKKVPILEVDWVDREVKVPQIQYKDKIVFTEHIKEVIKEVPERVVIEVPVEKIREIPVIEKRQVIKPIHTSGDPVYIPLPFLVEKEVIVPRYVPLIDPNVVVQTLEVEISESKTNTVTVIMNEYEPNFVETEVFVPVPIRNRQCICTGVSEEHEEVERLNVPAPQWNGFVEDLNRHLLMDDQFMHGKNDLDKLMLGTASERAHLKGLGSHAILPSEASGCTGPSLYRGLSSWTAAPAR